MEKTNVLHPGNKQATVKPQSPVHFSTLDLSSRFSTVQRFGQLGVCKVFESEPADNVPLYSAHKVESFTLSNRLMSDVYLKKDYFQVPRRAILPENFDKIYKAPPFGDDVPADASTSVANFSKKLSDFFYAWWTNESLDDGAPDTTIIPKWMKWLTCLQYFYSYGSLVSALGASFERKFDFTGVGYFIQPDGVSGMQLDQVVDLFYAKLAELVDTFYCSYAGKTYLVYTGKAPMYASQNNIISLRRLLEMLSDDPSANFSVTASLPLQNFVDFIKDEFSVATVSIGYDEAPYDLIYAQAYQMVCAHFFSNDSIDAVYSADIYRQVVSSIITDFHSAFGGFSTNLFFQYNGVNTQFDWLSAHLFDDIISNGSYTFVQRFPYVLRYFSVVFAWRNSLRFMDYFTGGRTNPLSVGNVTVPVVGSQVNVIEVITNTQRARYLNFANRSRRKLEGYLEDLTGEKPTHDWHNPLWLGHQADVIYSVETENTGDAQLDPNGSGLGNSITSRFISKSSDDFGFEVDVKEPSVLIGIDYFDIPRSYSHATHRMFFQKDRYDWFNEFMQTIGDQALYERELTDVLQNASWDFPFAYKVRHAEYKESYDTAKGALASGKLNGWLFTDDTPTRGVAAHIDSDFIRSSCTELDPFYLALSDYSLANYFHFIVTFYNSVNAKRNMIVAPTLL